MGESASSVHKSSAFLSTAPRATSTAATPCKSPYHSPSATGTNHGLTGNSAIVAFPAVLAWSRLSNSHGPANVNPILQSLRQGVRRARLRRAAPRPQSPPTSCPNSSAATGALRNGPNDETQYTRFVATLLTVAELGIRPCEKLGWNVRRYIHLPDTAVATRLLDKRQP